MASCSLFHLKLLRNIKGQLRAINQSFPTLKIMSSKAYNQDMGAEERGMFSTNQQLLLAKKKLVNPLLYMSALSRDNKTQQA
jgi:hypothetical protein